MSASEKVFCSNESFAKNNLCVALMMKVNFNFAVAAAAEARKRLEFEIVILLNGIEKAMSGRTTIRVAKLIEQLGIFAYPPLDARVGHFDGRRIMTRLKVICDTE
jgi:hypothetical protein